MVPIALISKPVTISDSVRKIDIYVVGGHEPAASKLCDSCCELK